MSMLFIIVVTLIFIISSLSWIFKRWFRKNKIDPKDKYVLISGCDSGFGKSLAIELDQYGFHVLAGIYNAENCPILKEHLSSRATVFKLDITCDDDVNHAFNLVQSRTSNLYALVNNAGIADGGLIDWVSMKSIRQVLEVNFFGHVHMTKRFLPLLITEENSRVINVSSAAGYLAAAGAVAYSSSKYALEAFSDCLRREMNLWKLHVSIIEPGFMRTPIIDGFQKRAEQLWNSEIDDETKNRWGFDYFSAFFKQGAQLATQTADDPRKVIDAMFDAIISDHPQIRYRPGWQSFLLCFPLSMLPASITDWIVNAGQNHMPIPSGILIRKHSN